jgi:subtilisin family serine protease
MKGSLSALLALTAFSSTSLAANLAAPGNSTDADIIPGVFMVEFHDDAQKDTTKVFQDLNRDLGLDIEPRLDISSKLFKGASFKVNNANESDTAATLLADSRIKQVWPVRMIEFPRLNNGVVGVNATESRRIRARAEDDDDYAPHVMTQIDRLHAEGITGKGISIAVLDTGIDYTHPSLGGCFGPGCLVAKGYDLGGDGSWPEPPVPDSDPMDDCHGHGTHVAGIIAAQSNNPYGVLGAAPGATIGAYKITIGCSGISTDEIMVAAFYKAYEDGNDILSLSYGEGAGWASDPLSVAINRIVEAGVPIAVAAGNTPQSWEIHKPASGRDITAVGSITNKEIPVIQTVGSFSIDGGDEKSFVMGPRFIPWESDVTKELWAVSLDTDVEDDACSPLPDDTPDLSDKIVLVRLNDPESFCQGFDKGDNVVAKGGKHILFYHHSDEDMAGELREYLSGVDAADIKASQAKVFVEALAAGKTVTVTISNAEEAGKMVENFSNDVLGGYMSSYTTWGPTWELEMKPQISAPGGNILSTWPVALGGWFVASGTSMAAPLVAAIYALVAEARGTTNPDTLRNAIVNTASKRSWVMAGQAPQPDVIAPVPQQGGGMIQAYDAARAPVILGTSSLSFNDTANIVPEQTFTIHNNGNTAVSFELEHVAAGTAETFMDEEGVRMPSITIPVIDAPAKMTFQQSTVSVPAGSSANVTVIVEPPTGLNERVVPVYSGFILLKATTAGATSLSLPYLGVAGKLRDMPTLDHELSAAEVTDSRGWQVEPGHTFVIPRPGEVPAGGSEQIIYPTANVRSWTIGIPVLRVDLVPGSCSGQGLTCGEDFFGVATLGPFHPQLTSVPRYGKLVVFDGQLRDGTVVPEGTYSFRIGALRMYGDESKEEDWDLKNTESFVLKYES